MQEEVVSISVLPEGCIANILSFTSPRDACSSALVCSLCKDAADSDDVWVKFLPSGYKDLLSKSPAIKLTEFSSKKQLYLRLCGDPVLLEEGGNKSVNLEKKSGKKRWQIGAKELEIHWGDTPEHWKWIYQPDSRFKDVAELVGVCWLYIKGKIETQMLSPQTTYVVNLVIKFTESAYGLDHPPADVSVEYVGGGGNASGTRTVYLDPECNKRPHAQYAPQHIGLIRRRYGNILRPTLSRATRYQCMFPCERGDGWLEIELGEFYNHGGDDEEVVMTLKETNSGHWKRGLVVEGIELRPKLIMVA